MHNEAFRKILDATVTGRDHEDLEIIGVDEKHEAMSVVFRLNIAKHGSGFEPRRKEESKISSVACCWDASGNGDPEKAIWFNGGLWMSFEKMVTVWYSTNSFMQGRNLGVALDYLLYHLSLQYSNEMSSNVPS